VGYEPYIPKKNVFAKPNVVFIGEHERYVDGKRIQVYEERNKVLASLTERDTVIVIGSSDIILDWSSMVGLGTPAYTVNVNIKKGENDWMFDKKIYKPVTKAILELRDIINDRMSK
jgi:NAD-dependent deacetylase